MYFLQALTSTTTEIILAAALYIFSKTLLFFWDNKRFCYIDMLIFKMLICFFLYVDV